MFRLNLQVVLCGSLMGAVSLGCDPSVFDQIKAEAPVVTLRAVGAGGQHGARVSAFNGPLAGKRVARVLMADPSPVSMEQRAIVSVFAAWTGTMLEVRAELYSYCGPGTMVEACPPNSMFGASFTGVERWGNGELCTVVGAPATGQTIVRCENGPGGVPPNPMILGSTEQKRRERYGAALASLPVGSSPGLLFVGAPAANSGAGGVYYGDVGQDGLPMGASTTGVRDLGSTLAVTPLAGGGSMLAVGPGPSTGGTRRVAVFVTARGGAPGLTACIDSMEPGFGSSIAFGDVTGDATPDMIVGSRTDDATTSAVTPVISIYDGAGLRSGTGCTTMNPVRTVGCLDSLGLTCSRSGFGSAIATGDFDGDSRTDIVVGAPYTTAKGISGSGALFLYHRAAADVVAEDAQLMLPANLPINTQLGTSVATFRSAVRDEIVAGTLAGVGYIFLCTPREVGRGGEVRCLPTLITPDLVDGGMMTPPPSDAGTRTDAGTDAATPIDSSLRDGAATDASVAVIDSASSG